MSDPNWGGPEPGNQGQPYNPTGGQFQQGQPYNPTGGQFQDGYQSPYGAFPGPVAPPYGTWSAQPPNYLGLAITAVIGGVLFSLILGMPLGLAALRNSRRTRSRWEAGDQAGALKASRSARSWVIAALVFDVIGLLISIVILTHAGHPAG